MKVKAFTIIELLVVILIIVIMVALFLPTLAQSRATAKSLQCQTNLRSIGLAIDQYRGRYNSWPSDMFPTTNLPYGEWGLIQCVSPYLDTDNTKETFLSEGVFVKSPWICPSDKEIGPVKGSSYRYYAYNAYIDYKVRRLFELPHTIVLSDIEPWHKNKPDGKNHFLVDGSIK